MTLFQKLLAASLPVSLDENGNIIITNPTEEQQTMFVSIQLAHYEIYDEALIPEYAQNAKEFAQEFQTRIDRLTQIATVAKPSPFTQADMGAMFDAIQDMARNQRAIMKRVK